MERRALWLFRQFARSLDDASDTLAIFHRLYSDEVKHVCWTIAALKQFVKVGAASDFEETVERLQAAEVQAYRSSYLLEVTERIAHAIGVSNMEP